MEIETGEGGVSPGFNSGKQHLFCGVEKSGYPGYCIFTMKPQ